MFSIRLLSKIFFMILVLIAFLCGGIFLWQKKEKKEKMFSDQQTIWLLVGLSVIAVISMGIFLVIMLGGLVPWQYFRIFR